MSSARRRLSDPIIAHAVRHGLSVTAHINTAIDEKMKRDDAVAE